MDKEMDLCSICGEPRPDEVRPTLRVCRDIGCTPAANREGMRRFKVRWPDCHWSDYFKWALGMVLLGLAFVLCVMYLVDFVAGFMDHVSDWRGD